MLLFSTHFFSPMTQLKHVFCLLLLVLLGLTGCKETEEPSVPAATVDLTATYDAAFNSQAASGVEVKLTNLSTRESQTLITDAQGKVALPSVPAGTYDITARLEMTPAQYLTFAGLQVANPVLFQASILNQTITPNQANSFALVLKAGATGDLVIKQVYYAGSDRVDGAVFRDQFIEIYNNSDQVLYADGLYVAQIEGNRSVPTTLPSYLLANGQYDWTKSLGMPATVRANDDYVYTKALFQFPGTGQQYPIQPGQSVVFAQTALNHKAPFTGSNGTTITVRNPNLTVNLSNATFEAYYNEGLASDIDNPAVPNVRLLQTFGNDMILDNLGRDGFAIFRSPTDAALLPKYAFPNVTTISATTKLNYQIPKALILDAVEAQTSPTSQVPKKFAADLDAGFTYTPAGSYSSQSVIRRVSKTFGTRRVLQDTNNSTTDFQAINLPTPFTF
jgi:hypothetical protein